MAKADRFKGKAAFITGAASGIGRSTAIAFAAEGARVVILYRPSWSVTLRKDEEITVIARSVATKQSRPVTATPGLPRRFAPRNDGKGQSLGWLVLDRRSDEGLQKVAPM